MKVGVTLKGCQSLTDIHIAHRGHKMIKEILDIAYPRRAAKKLFEKRNQESVNVTAPDLSGRNRYEDTTARNYFRKRAGQEPIDNRAYKYFSKRGAPSPDVENVVPTPSSAIDVKTTKAYDTGRPEITGKRVSTGVRRYTMGDNASLEVNDNTGSRGVITRREQVGNPARAAQQRQFQRRMAGVGTGRKFGANTNAGAVRTNWYRDSKPNFSAAGAGFSGSAKDAMIASAKRKYENEQQRSLSNLKAIDAAQPGQTARQNIQSQTTRDIAANNMAIAREQESGRNRRFSQPSGDMLVRGALDYGRKGKTITPKWVQKRGRDGEYLQEGFNTSSLSDPFAVDTSQITDEELLK